VAFSHRHGNCLTRTSDQELMAAKAKTKVKAKAKTKVQAKAVRFGR
jgi:hypothetical protein